VTRFLVALTRGAVEIFRLGAPNPVTLADGTRGESRDMEPIWSPDDPNGPTLAPPALAPHAPHRKIVD
jgi:hypothetical protein